MVRLKHRYLLINILYPSPQGQTHNQVQDVPNLLQFHRPSPSNLSEMELLQLIRSSIYELFGDYGMGKVAGSLRIVYFSPATSTMIIRAWRDHVRLLWAALSFITKLPGHAGEPCIVQVIRNSGTIRLAQEEAMKRAKAFLRRARALEGQDDVLEQALKSAVENEERDTGAQDDEDESMSDG